MGTDKMFVVAAFVATLFWCFRLTECEMKRIEANHSIGIITCQFMDHGCHEDNSK